MTGAAGSAMQQQGQDGWYVRALDDQGGFQSWHIAGGVARRADVTNPEKGPGCFFVANPGETIWEALRRQTPWLDGQADPGPFVRLIREPGHYHPRIARPLLLLRDSPLWLPEVALEQRYISSAQNQLQSLVADLQRICRVVQPTPATLGVHGHAIRNLLILAATEVEMHWRGILVANGSGKASFTTDDYVKLAEPLGLRDFSVSFHPWPEIAPVAPFAHWEKSKPSKSLPWYTAYHGVKHNREGEFERATLEAGFAAVAACAALLVAQFGQQALPPDIRYILSVATPAWPVEEMYCASQTPVGWLSVAHPSLA